MSYGLAVQGFFVLIKINLFYAINYQNTTVNLQL
jgi:hypothetical protein